MAAAEKSIADQEKQFQEAVDTYGKAGLSAEERDWLGKLNGAWLAYKAERDRMLALKGAGTTVGGASCGAATCHASAQQKVAAMQEPLQKLTQLSMQEANAANQQSRATYESARRMIIAVLLAALLSAVVVSLLLSRTIVVRVRALARAASDEHFVMVQIGQREDVWPALRQSMAQRHRELAR